MCRFENIFLMFIVLSFLLYGHKYWLLLSVFCVWVLRRVGALAQPVAIRHVGSVRAPLTSLRSAILDLHRHLPDF
jgi:hypothetical protein